MNFFRGCHKGCQIGPYFGSICVGMSDVGDATQVTARVARLALNMTQSGNPGGDLRCVSDIPTQKYEGSRGLRGDVGVGLRTTESEKYKLGFSSVPSLRDVPPPCAV